MAKPRIDGYFDLEFNSDKTQVFATLYPPQGGGAPVTAKAIMDRMRERGVVYGFREPEIINAAKLADETQTVATRVLVAQGVLPVDGKDAHVLWKVDVDAISQPVSQRGDSQIDFFALDDRRLVKAGQVLADIVPARAGSPGKTLTAPLNEVRQTVGKECTLSPGPGVMFSDDRTQLIAATDGYAELRRDKVSVYDITRIEGDLEAGEHIFTGDVVIMGGVKGGHIHAEGSVAIHGVAVGARIRAHGDIFLNQAVKTVVLTERSVHVAGALLHCELNCKQKVIAQEGTTIAGGTIIATEGVRAADLGAGDGSAMEVCVGQDCLSGFRLGEVEKEIRFCELNVQKITHALRPLTVVSSEPLSQNKKALVQKLADQRRGLEARIKDLLNERRTLANHTKTRIDAEVWIAGRAHPGVTIIVQDTEIKLEQPQQSVRITKTADGAFLQIDPLPQTKAA